jgi:hypothetical protein
VARDGTLRVLKAARDAGVKRVVMTSSISAIIFGRGVREQPFTEADWTDETNRGDTSPYDRAKTIAERAAWAWLAAEGGCLELVTVNPGLVLGPMWRDCHRLKWAESGPTGVAPERTGVRAGVAVPLRPPSRFRRLLERAVFAPRLSTCGRSCSVAAPRRHSSRSPALPRPPSKAGRFGERRAPSRSPWRRCSCP